MNSVERYYANQASGMPFFAGPSVQQGHGLGGIFSSIFRAVTPLLRSAAPVAKAAARSAVSEAARTGAEILSDVAQGADVKQAAKSRSQKALNRMVSKGAAKLKRMQGSRKRIKGKKKPAVDIFSR